MILVSACLAGYRCRYDGRCKPDPEIIELVRAGAALPFCPEQAGGCEMPRPAAEIRGGTGEDVLCGKAKVLTSDGNDRTKQFILGADEALRICHMYAITKAVLKSKSPSCGCGQIYSGSFDGTMRSGNGVTTAMLLRDGIAVETR